MARAIALSLENVRRGGGPFGAVVVRDGVIVGEGTNQVTASYDPTAHAEVVAVRAACATLGDFQLTGCEVYTSCEPCPMCLGALFWARPARIYFANTAADAAAAGFDDAFIYAQMARPHAERSIPMLPLMREHALAAFRAWAEKADKVAY
jgi:tRNA(Arg) A34 adenosine deaminase TadA